MTLLLQGIIQHVKNPKQAIINIASSCKYGSKIGLITIKLAQFISYMQKCIDQY